MDDTNKASTVRLNKADHKNISLLKKKYPYLKTQSDAIRYALEQQAKVAKGE